MATVTVAPAVATAAAISGPVVRATYGRTRAATTGIRRGTGTTVAGGLQDPQQPSFQAPPIPDDIEATDLDKEVRSRAAAPSPGTWRTPVARHLVAAGQVIDEDAELALQHAIAARRIASRIAVVREAVGLAAYAAGDWATAIAELRTYHRMSGRQTHLAEIADCERALGRPERAIDLFRGADRDTLDKAGAIELLIVAAGARGDLGQHDAAVAMLQVRELTTEEDARVGGPAAVRVCRRAARGRAARRGPGVVRAGRGVRRRRPDRRGRAAARARRRHHRG